MALTRETLEECVLQINEMSTERKTREAATIKIIVSFTVAQDYESRGVFPELRPQNAVKKIYGRGYMYAISGSVATSMFDDACAQYKLLCGRPSRGRKIAYGALRAALIGQKIGYEPSTKMKELWDKAELVINSSKDEGRDRRRWLAHHRPYQPATDKPRGRPNLSVAENCRLPAPLGFEDYVIVRLENWKETNNSYEIKKRVDGLWDLWLAFLGARCPFRDSDPEWSVRYECPDLWDLVYRIPELVSQYRRRFGTSYCRLVRENGREVRSWSEGLAL